MRGQYRLVMELLFFGIGVLLTAYVINSFFNARVFLTGIADESQLKTASEAVSTAIVKASRHENAESYVKIPVQISGNGYVIRAEDGNGGTCTPGESCFLNATSTSGTSVRAEIFNTANPHNINGFVDSAQEYAMARKTGDSITIASR
ncbi:MAG: hypothetical protein HY365_01515 [Candidatus Aenigmarchaeota archaeon]|nr:hypothetical protein [Candidatus Aenigmarchaeota archaeon]